MEGGRERDGKGAGERQRSTTMRRGYNMPRRSRKHARTFARMNTRERTSERARKRDMRRVN